MTQRPDFNIENYVTYKSIYIKAVNIWINKIKGVKKMIKSRSCKTTIAFVFTINFRTINKPRHRTCLRCFIYLFIVKSGSLFWGFEKRSWGQAVELRGETWLQRKWSWWSWGTGRLTLTRGRWSQALAFRFAPHWCLQSAEVLIGWSIREQMTPQVSTGRPDLSDERQMKYKHPQ